jgi:hypothetical protein
MGGGGAGECERLDGSGVVELDFVQQGRPPARRAPGRGSSRRRGRARRAPHRHGAPRNYPLPRRPPCRPPLPPTARPPGLQTAQRVPQGRPVMPARPATASPAACLRLGGRGPRAASCRRLGGGASGRPFTVCERRASAALCRRKRGIRRARGVLSRGAVVGLRHRRHNRRRCPGHPAPPRLGGAGRARTQNLRLKGFDTPTGRRVGDV